VFVVGYINSMGVFWARAARTMLSLLAVLTANGALAAEPTATAGGGVSAAAWSQLGTSTDLSTANLLPPVPDADLHLVQVRKQAHPPRSRKERAKSIIMIVEWSTQGSEH